MTEIIGKAKIFWQLLERTSFKIAYQPPLIEKVLLRVERENKIFYYRKINEVTMVDFCRFVQ